MFSSLQLGINNSEFILQESCWLLWSSFIKITYVINYHIDSNILPSSSYMNSFLQIFHGNKLNFPWRCYILEFIYSYNSSPKSSFFPRYWHSFPPPSTPHPTDIKELFPDFYLKLQGLKFRLSFLKKQHWDCQKTKQLWGIWLQEKCCVSWSWWLKLQKLAAWQLKVMNMYAKAFQT